MAFALRGAPRGDQTERVAPRPRSEQDFDVDEFDGVHAHDAENHQDPWFVPIDDGAIRPFEPAMAMMRIDDDRFLGQLNVPARLAGQRRLPNLVLARRFESDRSLLRSPTRP